MPGKLLWLEERKEAGTLPMPNWLLRHRCILPQRVRASIAIEWRRPEAEQVCLELGFRAESW